MTAAMVGWAHMPFGKHSEETVESMIVKVAVDAIKDIKVLETVKEGRTVWKASAD